MKTVYLDQNKWIELARQKKSQKADDIYNKILENVNNGKLCLPISVIHLMETLKRADKNSRKDVLDVMMKLSNGFSLLSFRDVEEAEVINAFAKYHDPSKIIKFSPVKSYPFYAMGAVPTLSVSDKTPPHIHKELNDILAVLMTEPSLFYKMLSILDSPQYTQADLDDDNKYVQAMHDDRKEIMSKPKQYRYKIYLVKNVMEVIQKYYLKISSIFNLTRETFIPSAALNGSDATISFLESMPSIDMRIKLYFDLLSDTNYDFNPHDSFDVLFLATAVPYSDIVITERTWSHRAVKTKLDVKYNTKIFSSLSDIMI